MLDKLKLKNISINFQIDYTITLKVSQYQSQSYKIKIGPFKKQYFGSICPIIDYIHPIIYDNFAHLSKIKQNFEYSTVFIDKSTIKMLILKMSLSIKK